MRIVVCDHKTSEQLENIEDVLRNHEVEQLVEEDPQYVYNAIRNMNPIPDIAVIDLRKEPEELPDDVPVQDLWGCRLIALLRNDPATSDIRIIIRSKFLPNDRSCLINLDVNPKDIVTSWGMNLRELVEIIEQGP